MASPPITPTTSLHRQSGDFFHSTTSPISRRSSAAFSPSHSRHGSGHAGDSLANELGGLGESLADELGGWNDEDDEYDSGEGEEGEDVDDEGSERTAREGEAERDSGIDITSSPVAGEGGAHKQDRGLLAVALRSGKGHRRKPSGYDGSEYGSDSDFEETQLVSASLEARLAAVESLARRGTGDVDGQENAIARATKQLQDLGAQATMENSSQRLSTAHSAISTHLTHQTRVFADLTQKLLGPLAPPLPPDIIDELLPAVEATLELLPTISPANNNVSSSLHSLKSNTSELIENLSLLSDTLQMMRQTSISSSRRLRSVKDALREWSREYALYDEGVRYIEREKCEERLKNRESAAICRDVLGGFEETCGKWREKLLASQSAAV